MYPDFLLVGCVGLKARLVGRGVLEMCVIAIVTNFVGSVKHNPIIFYRYGIRDTGVNFLSEKKISCFSNTRSIRL